MTRHDFFEVNGSSCLGCLPILCALIFLEFNAFVESALVCFCLGILFTNQCHKWAHMDAPPAFVRFLQRLRIVLRTDEHRLHHTPPYNSHFCTANGWLNGPLNRLLK
jgi:ubiquitin-conjugating enzyme E2 variant